MLGWMIRAFALSLGQLFDKAILSILLRVVALTLFFFLIFAALLWWGADRAADHYGWGRSGDVAAAIGAVVTGGLAAWLLFRVVAVTILNLFADSVVEAVERKTYPQALAQARPVGLATSLRMALASAARAIGLNLLLLPLYVALLFTGGIGTALVFFIANALLLGRDLGEMVAVRHLDRGAIRAWLATTRAPRFTLGLVATGLFVVPVANLAAPILGAAMATHLFHGRKS